MYINSSKFKRMFDLKGVKNLSSFFIVKFDKKTIKIIFNYFKYDMEMKTIKFPSEIKGTYTIEAKEIKTFMKKLKKKDDISLTIKDDLLVLNYSNFTLNCGKLKGKTDYFKVSKEQSHKFKIKSSNIIKELKKMTYFASSDVDREKLNNIYYDKGSLIATDSFIMALLKDVTKKDDNDFMFSSTLAKKLTSILSKSKKEVIISVKKRLSNSKETKLNLRKQYNEVIISFKYDGISYSFITRTETTFIDYNHIITDGNFKLSISTESIKSSLKKLTNDLDISGEKDHLDGVLVFLLTFKDDNLKIGISNTTIKENECKLSFIKKDKSEDELNLSIGLSYRYLRNVIDFIETDSFELEFNYYCGEITSAFQINSDNSTYLLMPWDLD